MTSARALISQIAGLTPGEPLDPSELEIAGTPGFRSAFALDLATLATAGAMNLAFGQNSVDGDRIRTRCTTTVLLNNQAIPAWAPLSGYYDTADGRFIQLHCNFDHHERGVVDRLGCQADRASMQATILQWDPLELESALIEDGMIAAYLRTLDEWEQHPHALATSDLPLISVERIGDGAPRPERSLRVLDNSRVLAGPVAGQVFASHGANVLRIDSPYLPSVDICTMATGSGKRNAFLDLRDPDDSATMTSLLADADVWIDAYRPNALASHGFRANDLSNGQVAVQLSAFDTIGPWASRRGFDSIVQSTTGVVTAGAEAAGVDAPTPLPIQALDYMTGFLAAFAAKRMVDYQRAHGGTWLIKVSLLRTRNWLTSLGGPTPFEPENPAADAKHLADFDTGRGTIRVPLPVGGQHHRGPTPLGEDAPSWNCA